MWQIAWVLAFGLCLGALGLAPGRSQRRSHFWLRLLMVPLVPACAFSIASAIVPIWRTQAMMWLVMMAIPAFILLPALLFNPPGSPPGGSGDDGGGPGPDPPPPPAPARPRGGIPLPDAEHARARVRDHVRPKLIGRRPRRPAPEPAREPRRAPAR
jgi:hypothetical protein